MCRAEILLKVVGSASEADSMDRRGENVRSRRQEETLPLYSRATALWARLVEVKFGIADL